MTNTVRLNSDDSERFRHRHACCNCDANLVCHLCVGVWIFPRGEASSTNAVQKVEDALPSYDRAGFIRVDHSAPHKMK